MRKREMRLGLPSRVGSAWRAAWACGLVAALLLAGGCDPSRREGLAGGGVPARPVAVVNNERITLDEYLNAYQLFFTRWDRFIQNDQAKRQEIKEIILANMIDEKLLDQEARRLGIQLVDEALENGVRSLMAPFSEEDVEGIARATNQSFTDWRGEFRRRKVHEVLIQREVAAKIRLSQREMRAYYERNQERFHLPEQVRVRHIAVSGRGEFRKLARLVDGGDFVKLVRTFSITPDRLKDGDLGYVERGVLPAEFDEAIFDLKQAGDTSSVRNPVKTQIGYHLFRLEDRKPERQLPFEEARPMIRAILVRQKQPAAFQAWMQELRERATIRIDNRLLRAEMG